MYLCRILLKCNIVHSMVYIPIHCNIIMNLRHFTINSKKKVLKVITIVVSLISVLFSWNSWKQNQFRKKTYFHFAMKVCALFIASFTLKRTTRPKRKKTLSSFRDYDSTHKILFTPEIQCENWVLHELLDTHTDNN